MRQWTRDINEAEIVSSVLGVPCLVRVKYSYLPGRPAILHLAPEDCEPEVEEEIIIHSVTWQFDYVVISMPDDLIEYLSDEIDEIILAEIKDAEDEQYDLD